VKRLLQVPVLILMMAGFLSACAATTPEPTISSPTETATLTLTPTITIDWFPATATSTPRPTQVIEPTPEMRPGIGGVLVEDLFSSEGEWRTGNFSAGNVTRVNDSVTIAIQLSKANLLSLESKNTLRNFNLDTKVQINLCRDQDVYGLLIRSASEWNYYRFLVNCQGYARAERIRDGATTLMQDWTPTGLPPGAPLEVSLGIWADGGEMRFFANNAFVFSVKDPIFAEGTIGVFARADGDSPVTVRFSEMKIHSINASQ
jgi:hypothetical protein